MSFRDYVATVFVNAAFSTGVLSGSAAAVLWVLGLDDDQARRLLIFAVIALIIGTFPTSILRY